MQLLQAQEATTASGTALKAVQRHAFAARAQRAIEQWRRGVAAAIATSEAAAAEAAEAAAANASPRRPAMRCSRPSRRQSTAQSSRR